MEADGNQAIRFHLPIPTSKTPDHVRLDCLVADARQAADARGKEYREQALKISPWIRGRCAREFTRGFIGVMRSGRHQ